MNAHPDRGTIWRLPWYRVACCRGPSSKRPERAQRAAFIALRGAQAVLCVEGLATSSKAVAEFHNVPIVEEDDWPKHATALGNISHTFLRESKSSPIADSEDGVVLAMEDPSDVYTINALRLAFGRPIVVRVAATEDIHAAIERSLREQEHAERLGRDTRRGREVGGHRGSARHGARRACRPLR